MPTDTEPQYPRAVPMKIQHEDTETGEKWVTTEMVTFDCPPLSFTATFAEPKPDEDKG